MSTINFTNPRARFFDRNGNPLSEGRVYFYAVGTTTLKDIYTTYAGDVLASNPQPLDIEGFVNSDTGIHLGEGLYDIKVEEKTGVNSWAQYWTYPNVQGATISGGTTSFTNINVGTIQNLRDLQGGSYGMAFVMGYYDIGDGGARQMYWNATSTKADNGGTVIVPQGSPAIGRWEWIPTNGDTTITPQLFGALPSDGSLVVASQVDSMINWCNANSFKDIWFNITGEYWINSSSTFVSGLNVIIDAGVQFKNASGSASLIFECESLNIKGTEQVVFPAPIGASITMEIRVKQPINVLPEWWGADPTTTFNSSWVLSTLSSVVDNNNVIEFNGVYSAGGTNIDYTGFTLQFNQGASIAMNTSDLIVDRLIVKSTDPIFTGDDLGLLYFVKPYAKSEWLEWTSATIIKPFLTSFIALNTVNGNRQFTFEVGQGIAILNYSIREVTTSNYYHLKFNWEFKSGALFSCNATGYIEFGSVNAGDYQIFSPISTGDFHLRFINDIKLTWFGAVSSFGDTTANANAIRSAYSQLVASNGSTASDYIQRITLDLRGGTYQTIAVVVAYNANFSDAIAPIKNGVIWGDVVTTNLFDFGHGIEGSNVTLESRGSTTKLLSIDESTIKFNRSNLICRNTLIDSLSDKKLDITDCDLYVTDASASTITMLEHFGKDSVIKGSKLHRLNVDATGPCNIILQAKNSHVDDNNSEGVTIFINGEGSVSNNYLEKASIVSNNPLSTIINGNSIRTSDYMDSKILFTGTSTHLVIGLICENNTFVDGVFNPATRTQYSCIVKSGSFATSGHKCSIKNNYINNVYLRAMATTIDALSSLGTLLTANTYKLTIDFKEATLTSPLFFDLVDNIVNVNEINHAFLNGGGGNHDGYLTFYAYETAPLGDFILDIKPYVNNYLGSLSLHIVASTLQTPFQPIGTIAVA